MPLVPDAKNCDISVKRAIQGLSNKLGYTGSPTFANTYITNVITASTSVFSKTCTLAAGLNVLRVTGLQTDATALTGTLRGAYIDVSNGSTAATGTIRALELKARTEAPGDTGNNVAVLEGLSISADSKGHSVTTMRAAEFILDGKTGGTITEAVGLRIANNLQANKATTSYGIQIYRDSFDYTYDISLSLGGHITGDSYVNQDYRTTASPTFAGLHINSAEVTSTTLLTLESDINNNNEYNEILFKVVGGQNYGAIRSCVGVTGGDSYMSFFTTTDGGTLVRQVTIQHDGKVGLGTYNPETLLTMVSAAPYLTLYNITEEDTDGGGESRLIYKRERSGGESTAAFQFEASHDGSSDDQLGKGVWSVNTGAGLVEGMRLDSSLTATFAGVAQATDFAKTGWPVTPGVTLSFVGSTTRTFTVTDGSSAYYYIDGVKYTLGENKTVVIDDIEGLWFIYFDGATLTASQTIWGFTDENKVLVGYLYWARDVETPANGKAIFIGWELHSFHMSGATHARLHYAGGARWETGLLVADAGSGNVNVSAGDIWDEDLNIPITDGAGSALFEQVLSPAQLPIYYREGASAWRIYETNEKAALTDVGYLTGGDLKYNDPTTTWSNETVGLNNYVAYYVVATNEQTEPVALIMGQRVDNKLSEAKANNVFSGLSLVGLPFEEMVVLARLILKDTGTYTLEEVLDLRAYNIKGNITSPLITQHAGLGGLNWSSAGHYFDAAVDFNAQNISNIGTIGCGVITQSGATLAATYQPLDDVLTDLAALTAVADNEFIVGTGAGTYGHENATTAATSMGLGTGDSPTFTNLTLTGKISVPATSSSTVGVIEIVNGFSFVHGYGPAHDIGTDKNTFVGTSSGNFTISHTTGAEGRFNTGVGAQALQALTTGSYNVGVGYFALAVLTSGTHNMAIGGGGNLTTGDNNVCIGISAGWNISTTDNNVSIGDTAGLNGANGTSIGYKAGLSLQATALGNVLIGFQAGNAITTGDYNIIIGYDIDPTAADASNELNIGGTIFGKLDTNKIGINDNNPLSTFDVTGDVNSTVNYKVDDVQVVSNRVIDDRCDDAINSGDVTTDGVIDSLRDAMITHGLIAAA